MNEVLFTYIAFIMSVFAMMNPLAAVPIFLSLSKDIPEVERKKIPLKTATAAFLIMLIAFVIGQAILDLFSVGIPALRLAGGMVLMAMGWSMLNVQTSRTKQTAEEAEEAVEKDSIAIIPLAIPISAGPGAISLMIIAASYPNGIEGRAAIMFAVFLVCVLLWLFLRMADRIGSFLGSTGLNIITRLMGLLMLGVSIEFITTGLIEKFPILGQAG